MATIGTDHTTARRVSLGMCCLECDADFVKAHGFPVACDFCWKKLPLEERKVVARATNAEATKEAFKQIARAKRAKRNDGNS